MAFPTLFPFGVGDPTDPARVREVSLSESLKHLIKFGECNEDGKYTCKPSTHPCVSNYTSNVPPEL